VATAFMIFGVPNPVLWGVLGAIAALIPGIGTALVLLPAAAYLLFAVGDAAGALGLFVWWVSAVLLIDNMLGPHLVGRGAQLHPLVVLLSVLGGVAFFGPAGIFFGPLCISFLFAVLSVYSKPASTR
jgi:predicted PurR-regulated permease PerM